MIQRTVERQDRTGQDRTGACVCVRVFRGVNQPPANSGLSYHYCSLALRVHLDWDCQFAASIEFRLYALSYRISKSMGLQLPPLHIML